DVRLEAQVVEQLPGGRVALRVNPGGVERVGPAGDLQEPGRLGPPGLADSRHLLELFAFGERTAALAELDQLPGRVLVQSGDVPEQRHAGRVQVHADVVDARLD